MVYHQKDSLSQNFIKYPQLVAELLRASDINKDDTVLEIGPGKGIITRQLCQTAKSVISVEKDESLANELTELSRNFPNLKIVKRDFLDFNLPGTRYKIFSNIPFSITAKIIHKILKSEKLPESMYLIMQLEAAEKFIGVPAETQSSVLTKPFYEIKILGNIDRSNFTLKPQVKIVFTEFKKRENPFIKTEDKSDFFDFVIFGFNQWKLNLADAYKNVFTFNQLDHIKKTFNLQKIKPSELSFDNWLLFFKTYKKITSEEQRKPVRKFEAHYKSAL